MGYYVLDEDNNAIPWPDQKMLKWAGIFEDLRNSGRTIVKQEYVGPYWVSTVFLGLDHKIPRQTDNPHIFETMVFEHQEGDDELGPGIDGYTHRYSTWKKALLGHNALVVTLQRQYREATT